MRRAPGWAALTVAAAAFLLYRSTLLPGFDFGDTASFQTVVGSPIVSPRDAYPLYFAIAGGIFRLLGGDPAHALNVITALESAAACGLLTLLAVELSGSIAAGAAAALLFAGSYTFWSQSVIAEVYGLHIGFVALTMWLLLRWEARPSTPRLACFFAVYACGFGNHLSMILLAPAYTFFLLASAPRGWRSLLRPRIVALAVVLAATGAAQYAWNLRTLWFAAVPPHGVIDAIQLGWFDITKSDWRDTMVMHVPSVMLPDHAAMYLFDLRQQFGWAALPVAAVGAGGLWAANWRRAVLLLGVYLANVAFAFGYNVGDTHVFYLPSHAILALLTAPGLVCLARAARRPRAHAALAAVAIAYACARIYLDYPALDRSGDRRPTEILDRLTAQLDDRHAVLITDLNWQVQNGLTYYGKRLHPEIAYARMPQVLPYAPALVRDNAAIGRDVALTSRAAAILARQYGPFVPTTIDERAPAPGISAWTSGLPRGTRYVLCVLKPTRDFVLDRMAITSAVSALTAGRITALPPGDYLAIAGLTGEMPTVVAAADRPFRRAIEMAGATVQIRMESWLAADTIRRMGFGHVIANRHHTLIVERGASFVAFDRTGAPIRTRYAGGIFGEEPRYLCYR